MDPEFGNTIEEPKRRSLLVPILVALGVGLVLGVILGRIVQSAGGGIEIVQGTVGAASEDRDALALEDGDSYDLTHASFTGCPEQIEPGTDVELGIATIDTEDSDAPPEAFLNTPQATVVMWVECLGGDGADL